MRTGTGRRGLLPSLVVAVALVGPPMAADAGAQAGPATGSGYAILAMEDETGRAAAAAVSSLPAGASRGLRAEAGAGAVFATGRNGQEAAAAAIDALRTGAGAAAAARAGAGVPGSGRVVVLDAACADGSAGGGSLVGSVQLDRGRSAGLCHVAVAFQPPGSGGMGRMSAAWTGSRGPLSRRLVDALAATGPSEGALRAARSAALWVSPRAGGAADGVRGGGVGPDRAGLRLQAEDHPRPAARLEHLLRLVEGRELADRAAERIAAGSYREAAAAADSALELDPGSTAAWMHRGRALLYDGRADQAEEAFRRMLELDPTLLRFLGDPTEPTVNEDVIPYAPRLLLRLDVYRRAYFRTVDFGPEPASPEGLPRLPSARDTAPGGPGDG